MRWMLIALAACGSQAHPAPSRPDLVDRFPLAKLDDRALCDHLLARTPDQHMISVDAEPRTRRKVIVSDLHLGPGTTDRRFAGLEDFYADTEWAAFLEREGAIGPMDLVIAGDFIEFWQIASALGALPAVGDPKQPRTGAVLASDQAASLTAIELAIAAHPTVFRALGRLLDTGDHRVVIIAGNHDADLLWPKVQLAIARAVNPRDPARLVFVEGVAYQHAGVYIAHGHELDAANRFATQHAPFGRDRDGRCRLQTNWGEVFVDVFYTETERQIPFIDNLYPEKAAVVWGLRDNPDLARDIGAAARAVDLLRVAQGRGLNRNALGSALQGALGMPGKERGPESSREVIDHVLDRLVNGDESTEALVVALADLATDPELETLRHGLAAAAVAMPDLGAARRALSQIDSASLGALRDRLFGDLMVNGATALMRVRNVDVVVLGHTHSVGGGVNRVEVARGRAGYYANTGSWISVASVAELRAKGITWDQLNLADRATFPSKLTSVVVEYDGATPRAPAVRNAR
ncbi:MAG TPA: hypothetical protein VIV11_12340 [Kofleriaceae bacterium]